MDVDECTSVGVTSACGRGALCSNTAGSFTCRCPAGTTGDASPLGACLPAVANCASDSQCRTNEQCQAGVCVCSPPFFVDR